MATFSHELTFREKKPNKFILVPDMYFVFEDHNGLENFWRELSRLPTSTLTNTNTSSLGKRNVYHIHYNVPPRQLCIEKILEFWIIPQSLAKELRFGVHSSKQTKNSALSKWNMHLTAVFKFWKRNVGRCLSDSLAELKINVKGTMNNKDIIKLNHNITGKKKNWECSNVR